MVGWENPSVFHCHLERFADTDREIVSRIGIDEAFSVHIPEIQRFGEYFADRERTSFVFRLGIIARVSEHSVDFSENELGTVGGDESGFASLGKELRENFEQAHIFGCTVRYAIDESIEFFFFYVGEMIMFYDVHSDIEELEPDTERGEPEVRRLHEDDDGALRELQKLRFDGFLLWIGSFVVRSVLAMEKGCWRISELLYCRILWQYCFVGIGKHHRKGGLGIVEEVDPLARVGEILVDDVGAGLFERSHGIG